MATTSEPVTVKRILKVKPNTNRSNKHTISHPVDVTVDVAVDVAVDADEIEEWKNVIIETTKLYMKHGARSSAKVNHFHGFIQNKILELIRDKPEYRVELEHQVAATNSSGSKRCDIVVLKNNIIELQEK